MLIAICAILLTIQQGLESRRHSRLSVRPDVGSETNRDRNEKEKSYIFTYSLYNYGLGPARIKDIKLFLNGAPFSSEEPVQDIIVEAFEKKFDLEVIHHSWPSKGYVLPEKKQYQLAKIVFKGFIRTHLSEIERTFKRMDIRLEYESFYDEHFEFDSRTEIGGRTNR
jgi:hypothetical protein